MIRQAEWPPVIATMNAAGAAGERVLGARLNRPIRLIRSAFYSAEYNRGRARVRGTLFGEPECLPEKLVPSAATSSPRQLPLEHWPFASYRQRLPMRPQATSTVQGRAAGQTLPLSRLTELALRSASIRLRRKPPLR